MSYEPLNNESKRSPSSDFCFRGKGTKNNQTLVKKNPVKPPRPSFGQTTPLMSSREFDEADLYVYQKKHVKLLTKLVMFLNQVERKFNEQWAATWNYVKSIGKKDEAKSTLPNLTAKDFYSDPTK